MEALLTWVGEFRVEMAMKRYLICNDYWENNFRKNFKLTPDIFCEKKKILNKKTIFLWFLLISF